MKPSRAEIYQFFLVVFWKIDDFINTFWLHLTFSLPIFLQCMKSRPNEHLCKFHNCHQFWVSASLEPRMDNYNWNFLWISIAKCFFTLLKSQKIILRDHWSCLATYLEFKSECTVWKKASLPTARLEKNFLAIARK